MFKVKQYEDKFGIYRLEDETNKTWVEFCPQRGGIITSLGIDGVERLYLDKETFYDLETNIRGGIPILFPICGVLEDKKYELNGKVYEMKNHGLARINNWTVESIDTSENSAVATLTFKSDAETLKSYPFEFCVTFKYILEDGKLKIEQDYANNTDEIMPIYVGFHPYFKADSKNLEYKTDATKYLDENDNLIKEYTGKIDLEGLVESPIFTDATVNNIEFRPLKDEDPLFLEYGKEFKYVVLWSVDGKDFVCVEPWMALGKSFNTKKDLYEVCANSSCSTYFTIETK